MQIKVISVGERQKSPKFSSVEIVYKNLDKDKVETKKLVDFKYPVVFKTLIESQKDDVFDISIAKEGEYWQWTDVSKSGEVKAVSVSSPEPVAKGRVTGSNYETPEERAKRQQSIVRQSSLSNAIATLKTDKAAANPEEVLALAAQYESWVNREEKKTVAQLLNEMEDDVPL